MVYTRKQYYSQARSKQQKDLVQQLDSKSQSKTKPIIKESRLDKTAIRKVLRERLKGRKRRDEKMIRFDDDAHLSAVADQRLSCPICLEFLLEPVLTPCGHVFCLPCVEESLRHKTACSICRHSLSLDDPLNSRLLSRILSAVSVKKLTGEDAVDYQKRRQAFKVKQVERHVSHEVKVGDMVDYYFQRSWQEGQVAAIKSGRDHKTLSIKSLQRDAIVCELGLNSRLLARFRSFTKQPVIHRNSMIQFDFEEQLFNSISNSVYFFLDTPLYHRIEIVEMDAL